jgi:spoIIIJ-associated protein
MSSSDSVETTAATIDQAINQALAQLGAGQDDVTIEVLSTPRAGVLGLGARQARVRVTRRPPEGASSGVTSPPPAPPLVRQQPVSPPTPPPPLETKPVAVGVDEFASEEAADEVDQLPLAAEEPLSHRQSTDHEALAREATAVLAKILALMDEKAEIETVRDFSAANVELNIKGDGSGLLIGRRGQTLDALEYVVNRILARQLSDPAPVSIDTESYRARRRRQLHRMALSKGEQAKREHVVVELDPMPPRDRRIVHLALKDDPLVTTRSSGEGFLRSIQILPVEEHREGHGQGGRERRRERERGRERDGERSQVGQQGGFKHGQKKIV